MYVKLHQRRIADCFETVNLSGLDDKDVATTAFESLATDGPHSAAFTNELNLVIRMPMRTRPGTGLPVGQVDRHTGLALIGSDKLMSTTNKRQVLLTNVMHSHSSYAFDELRQLRLN